VPNPKITVPDFEEILCYTLADRYDKEVDLLSRVLEREHCERVTSINEIALKLRKGPTGLACINLDVPLRAKTKIFEAYKFEKPYPKEYEGIDIRMITARINEMPQFFPELRLYTANPLGMIAHYSLDRQAPQSDAVHFDVMLFNNTEGHIAFHEHHMSKGLLYLTSPEFDEFNAHIISTQDEPLTRRVIKWS
jgi:hypothetical protein